MSQTSVSNSKPVIIVGGGFTGLSAAWELQQRGVPYVLLEAKERLGGKVQTAIHTAAEQEFLVEQAADAFILGKPWALELAREVGLEGELIHPREETKRLYFLKGGQLLDFPQPLKMFIPLVDAAFRASSVLSEEGTARMLAEVDVPPKANTGEDESLASFVVRRFGAEALNFIVPMAAGIYVADPYELSMQASFPQFLAMEQQYGSLIRAARAAGPSQGPIFASFKGGMSTLHRAVAGQLTGDVRLNARAAHIGEQSVTLSTGEVVEGRSVLVTLPAWEAAPALRQHLPAAAEQVARLKTNSSLAVVLAYREADLDFDMNMHGLLVDWSEDTPMSAITVHSGKMAGRAPKGTALMRVFFRVDNSAGQPSPEEAYPLAREAVRRLFGATAEPLLQTHADWRGKNPAYVVGHLQQVADIRAALPDTVKVAGASFTGVGIPDCVRAGRLAAQELAKA